jgi:hypothetical protein
MYSGLCQEFWNLFFGSAHCQLFPYYVLTCLSCIHWGWEYSTMLTLNRAMFASHALKCSFPLFIYFKNLQMNFYLAPFWVLCDKRFKFYCTTVRLLHMDDLFYAISTVTRNWFMIDNKIMVECIKSVIAQDW